MGRVVSKEELHKHKSKSIQKLESYINALIETNDPKMQGKADKLSYWLNDWSVFLGHEPHFAPNHLRRYKRGEIMKVHLGFNVGCEEGGLHYCVVLDKDNSIYSPVITIVPLTSVKDYAKVKSLPKGNVYLGNELFTNLQSKISLVDKTLDIRSKDLRARVDRIDVDSDTYIAESASIENELIIAEKELLLIKRMYTEVQKMKKGSIALTNQIRTISKIRVYDPKTNYDILSGVKLSNQKLDMIDEEIIRNFTGKGKMLDDKK